LTSDFTVDLERHYAAELRDERIGPMHRSPLEIALEPALARRLPPAVLVKDFLLLDLANLFSSIQQSFLQFPCEFVWDARRVQQAVSCFWEMD
jgi:hypothetical protein